MPGAGFLSGPIFTHPKAASVDEHLDAAEHVAAALEDAITAQVDGRLHELAALVEKLAAPLHGRADELLAKAETRAGKLVGKMDQASAKRLDNAYHYVYALGGNYPTVQQVASGLQTGDFLGTMGAAPGLNSSSPHVLELANPSLMGGAGNDTIGVGSDGDGNICPPGYHWNPLPDPITGEHCAAIAFGTITGGLGNDITVDDRNNTCPCNWKIGPAYLFSQAAYGTRENSGYEWIQPWTAFDPGMSGRFIRHTVTCIDPISGAMSSLVMYGPELQSLMVRKTDGALICSEPQPANLADLVACDTASAYDLPDTIIGADGNDTIHGGSCPVPAAYPCGTNDKVKPPKLTFADNNFCQQLGDLGRLGGNSIDSIFDLMGMGFDSSPASGMMASILKVLGLDLQGSIPVLINRLKDFLKKINKEFADKLDCDVASLLPIAALEGVTELFAKWAPVIPPQYTLQVQQISNTACQSKLPSGAEASAARLADTIDKELWECWHKAEGNRLKEQEALFQAGRGRPNAGEVAALFRRQQLTLDQYTRMTRGNGVLNDEDKKALYDLTQAWPGLADLVRFMVRDTADPDIEKKFELSKDFNAKYQGELKDYAQALGVTDKLMLNYWKAHWQLPSYTQLAEMMFRLRPGRVGQDISVDEDDVKTALEQNDMLPYWVPRLMAIARPTLTRTDLLVALGERSITDEFFKEGLKDLGYDDEKTEALFATYDRKRKLADNKASGLPTAAALVRQYAAGIVTDDEFTEVAEQITFNEQQRLKLEDAAERARRWKQRQCAMMAIKKQYVHGLIGDGEASGLLATEGVDAGEIDKLIYCWAGDRMKRGKQASAAQLCQWRNLNIINSVQQAAALRNLGWGAADASRIIRKCELDQAEKMRKAEEAAMTKAEARAKKPPSRLKAAIDAQQAKLLKEEKERLNPPEQEQEAEPATTP